ncbi:MAG: pyridoxamine 5'-phosphate oxidase [Actinobacteria bacterium]|nr:MAG: pyridoxamine 5'-phosphate oxidase [Actinomycetota bacterium]
MASWAEFAADAPRLAEAIRSLIHQYGPGLGYLATVRADGGPRVHPVAPVITDDGLYCFVIDSPKRRDLERDGRYALHSFPPEDRDDEAYVAGRARLVTDYARVAELAGMSRAAPEGDWRLFGVSVDVGMLARGGAGGARPLDVGAAAPVIQVWRDSRSAGDRRAAQRFRLPHRAGEPGRGGERFPPARAGYGVSFIGGMPVRGASDADPPTTRYSRSRSRV